MNTLPSNLIHRLAAAVAAGFTTLALFSAVVTLSEPQRSELIAANAVRQAEQAQALAQAQRPQQTLIATARPATDHVSARASR